MLDPAAKIPAKTAAYRTPWPLLALLIAMTGVSSLSLTILVPAIPGLVAKFAADPASVQLDHLALSPRPRGGATRVRAAVRPLRPPAGRARRARARHHRQHRGHLRREHRGPDHSAGLSIARRLDRANHRPRHHPRSLRPRARRLHDRAGRLGGGAHADAGAVHRRRARYAVRLGIDLHLLRCAELHGVPLGGGGVAGDAAVLHRARANESFSRRPRRARRRALASSATRCARGWARRRSSAFSAAPPTWW